jgi:hypothetical protein
MGSATIGPVSDAHHDVPSEPPPAPSRAAAVAHPRAAKDENLILDELSDRLETLKLFREDDPARADALLEQFGAQGEVESRMLAQLGVTAPLAHPDRFEQAHRTAMHALEVFDRNAGKAPANLKAGILTAIAVPVVQQVIGIVVRSYQSNVIASIRELYAQRQASSERASPEYQMLRNARRQADRLAPALTRKTPGLPAFLLGGAVLSGATSLLHQAVDKAWVLLLLTAVFAVIALGSFWCVVKGAAIARRRTRIALDQPLRALWETIGAAGSPPADRSRQFAISGAVLLVAVWVVVPIALGVAAARW